MVPETALLDAVLATMRRERAQFAVVIDEHGGTSGVVTLEDLFEEVVGEIDDSPEQRSGPRRDSSGRLRVPGTMRLDELGPAVRPGADARGRGQRQRSDPDACSGGRRRSATASITDGCELDVTATKGRGVDEAAVTLHESEDDEED